MNNSAIAQEGSAVEPEVWVNSLHSRFTPKNRDSIAVRKLCIFIGTTIGGYVGWALGEKVGFEMLGCFVVSGVGSVVGVYAGWKLAEKLEE